MAEIAFLDAVKAYLAGPAELSPAPGTVGFGVPVQGDPLPLLSLSLGAVERVDIGLGSGTSVISKGSLPVTSTIDLADPVLPGPDGFVLLDGTRRVLTLPHGGLIRADALEGALGPGDITVAVAGTPRNLVTGPPGPAQYIADPAAGMLTFGEALPGSGDVVASYHLGVWERSATLVRGDLDLSVWDDDVGRLGTISAAAIRALLRGAGGPLPGLRKIRLASVGEIGAPQTTQPRARQRLARFGFDYEHIVDTPVSSGGIIRRIPITTKLAAFVKDPNTGALVESVEVETEA